MWDFIKLTLCSNDRQTMIRVHSIVQMYEDIDSNGKECTRIDFENDFTRVKEDMLTIITLIRNTRLNSIYGLTGVLPIFMLTRIQLRIYKSLTNRQKGNVKHE